MTAHRSFSADFNHCRAKNDRNSFDKSTVHFNSSTQALPGQSLIYMSLMATALIYINGTTHLLKIMFANEIIFSLLTKFKLKT